MAASRTVVNWDDVTEKRLLEAILANSVVSATDWAAVAVHIGEQVTGHACNWDEKYEFRLLLEIITVQCNASGLAIDWGAVAGGVKDGLTPKACMLVFPATPPPFSRLPPFTLLNTQQPTLLSPSTMPRPANGSQFKWDDATEKRLLLAVLSNCIVPPNLDWAAIASGVDSQVTASSASQKFAKIKKRDADIFTTAAGTASANVSTPVKPKATPKRGRSKATPAAAAAATDDDDDEEEMATPAKKAKKSAKKERKESTDEDKVL
ncbi:hypothetical protein BLS_006491 [Venturia inaequalis]|uniref:Uncharacterized protein n=1 Tax=Venturia inaequalis TaxID=5025 RepID=A0A8H3V4X8_VENIN|nr:hypothetical protein BLS_006491 [Venturia inaequalis]